MATSWVFKGSVVAVLLLSAALGAGSASAQGTGPARCYFGECAGEKPVATPEPAPQPTAAPPAFSPPVESSVDPNQLLEQYMQQLQSAVPAQAAAPAPATMCVTMAGGCWMGQAIPVGSSCFCPSPFGNVFGIAQ